MWPDRQSHQRFTDSYFNLTRQIVKENGDAVVTYAVFMRRPVTLASKLAIEWLLKITEERGVSIKIEKLFKGGAWVGAGEPMFYLSGSMVALVDLETIFLQKLGAACVAAYNAYQM